MSGPTDRFSLGTFNVDPNDSNPSATTGIQPGGSSGPTQENAQQLGPLLDLPPEKAAKLAQKYWDRQNQAMEKRTPRWQANVLRRRGYANVIVQKAQDSQRLTVYVPRGSTRTPPSLNKAARLCRRLKANIFVDPPTPECVPTGDGDDAREAAESATKVLQDLVSPAGYNGLRTARRAFDIASSYGSGFVRMYVDPVGGGMQPVEIQASPQATSVADATHQQGIDPMGQPTETPWPGDLVTRYVGLDGQSLTDDPNQAKRDWVPALKEEILKGTHVRLLPETAMDISDADGALIASFSRLGELKKNFPDAYDWENDDDVRKLLNFVPEQTKDLLPFGQKQPRRVEDEGVLGDDTEIYVLTVYYAQCPLYPKGAYCIFAGGETAIDRRPWVAEIEDDNGNTREDPLDVPLAQFKQFDEGDEDAYGYGAMDLLGTGSELRNALYGYAIELLEQTAKRKLFVPINSAIKATALQGPTGMPIPYNAQAGVPVWEEVPEVQQSLIEMRDKVTEELDDEIGLQAVSQGMTDPSVQSGLHAQQLIEQVAAALSDVKQNTEDGIERMWRVTLQLWRAFVPNARRVQWTGDDGQYKEKALSAADIRDTRDVRIMKGSFTMLTPSAKAAVTQSWMAAMMISPTEARRLLRGNVAATTGAQEDPQLMRVRRQIARFEDGPPDGFEAQVQQASLVQQQQAMAMQPEVDAINQQNAHSQMLAQAGHPAPPMQQPPQVPQGPPPVQGAPFMDALPVDTEPQVAQTRYEELSAAMAGTRYSKQPPFWQQYLVAEWQRMRAAIQQAAAAQQAAMQPHTPGTQPLGGASNPPALAMTANPQSPKEPAQRAA